MNINDLNTWLWVAIGIATIVGGIWGAVRFLGRQVTEQTGITELKETLETIKSQYKNNGGSSMRDAVDKLNQAMNRVEMNITSIQYDITRLDKAIERHVGYHEGADL